jgi:glycosyltransferase involved in cell wall biosynthesis
LGIIIKIKQNLTSISSIVFFIGSVFPEPKSSAAGTRILQLVKFFKCHGYDVVFGSASKKSEHSFDLKSIGVQEVELKLNDSSFDDFVKDLNPHCVVFDRFITEEQFGWRLTNSCPDAIKILDTEDLHFLRKARKSAACNTTNFSKEFLNNDIAKRELASIYRSDLSLIISEIEFNILCNELDIDASLLLYLPFLLDSNQIPSQNELPTFTERKNFVFVGSFIHPPNANAVLYLKTQIWSKLRKKLPNAVLHIFGSYPKAHHLQLQNKKEKFFVHGFVDDIDKILLSSKVLLAPLQFGAGLKGKVLDAMRTGTPCVLSEIAAEGVYGSTGCNGFVSNNDIDFVENAVTLYTNENIWTVSQENGFKTLKKRFLANEFYSIFNERIQFLENNLKSHRLQNFTGILLQHHSMQSTKYFSKWIEAKNRVV